MENGIELVSKEGFRSQSIEITPNGKRAAFIDNSELEIWNLENAQQMYSLKINNLNNKFTFNNS